jgi:BlaI family penicillinase repressor
MKRKVRFTPRELDIMAILWDNGPSTAAEVRGMLKADLAHNTVLTWLTLLEQKGYVAHTKDGRSFRFHARIPHKEAGLMMLNRLIDQVFGGSAERMLQHLVASRDVGVEELRSMQQLIEGELAVRV